MHDELKVNSIGLRMRHHKNLEKTYPMLYHWGHWLNVRGGEPNELIGKWITKKDEKLQGWIPKTKERGWREAGGQGDG